MGTRPRMLAAGGKRLGPALALAALLLVLEAPALLAQVPLLRGDSDHDGRVLITDPVYLLNFLFLGGPPPLCDPVADADNDGDILITDCIYVLTYLFIGGDSPPELDQAEISICSNDPPLVPSRPIYRAYAGFLVEFAIDASDPEGDACRYEAFDFPAGAGLDPETGVLRWTPAEDHQLGSYYLQFAVSDAQSPPASTQGVLIFQVETDDACTELLCDPAAGCQTAIIPLGENCCAGEPQVRIAEPSAGCPEGRVAYVGRNIFGFGRIRNCDRLRLAPLGQGGVSVNLNFEARCLNFTANVSVRARLETAQELLFDLERGRTFQPRSNGFYERRGVGFITEPLADLPGLEGKEANLTIWLRDADGIVLERTLRVVLTLNSLEELPETP